VRNWWTNTSGGAGWLAAAGLATGLFVWWPISVASIAGWVAFSMVGYRRSARAVHHLQDVFPEATHVGLRNEVRCKQFAVRNSVDTLLVKIATPLPETITIHRTRGLPLGDPAFDTQFRVEASDRDGELACRTMLTAELRAQLCALFAGYSVELHQSQFDIVIHDEDADGAAIERLIRDGLALGVALAQRIAPITELVERIPREPVPSVRMNHYVWLVHHNHEVPAILRMASQDSDDEIRRWAESQRPSETLYR
jgi:hypothetical protein